MYTGRKSNESTAKTSRKTKWSTVCRQTRPNRSYSWSLRNKNAGARYSRGSESPDRRRPIFFCRVHKTIPNVSSPRYQRFTRLVFVAFRPVETPPPTVTLFLLPPRSYTSWFAHTLTGRVCTVLRRRKNYHGTYSRKPIYAPL